MHFKPSIAILSAALALPVAAQAAPASPPPAFATCKGCHTVKPGEKATAGPNLFGISTRKAATAPGYNYSPAMKKSGLVWNKQTLTNYLRAPARKVPGTKMTFGGQTDPKKVDDLVNYLLSLK